MPPTRSGVYYDLSESPYTFECRGIRYYFSTPRHMERFLDLFMEREEVMTRTMSKRVGITEVDMRVAADLQLYRQIETRGFHVVLVKTGEVVTCREHLRLDGLRPSKSV